MEKECCNVKVTETEDGFRIDVKGEGLKDKVETIFKNCCGEEMRKKWSQRCCESSKELVYLKRKGGFHKPPFLF